MSFQDVLNVAIVVILVYLCLSGLVERNRSYFFVIFY